MQDGDILTVVDLGGGVLLQTALVDPSLRRAGILPVRRKRKGCKMRNKRSRGKRSV